MKVDAVVDLGNTRSKWGRCTSNGVELVAAVPPNDRAAWQEQWQWSKLPSTWVWAVSGVNPTNRDHFASWLSGRAAKVVVLDSWRQLPLNVNVEEPGKVGIDRLLDALAANSRVQREGSKIIIDAGTAVTVDWVDPQGVFRGGAILPGFRLMVRALHDYTALLPQADITASNPPMPGTSTESALAAGVFWSVAGGIKALIRRLAEAPGQPRDHTVFLTGGDGALLAPVLDSDVIHWPEMTLAGIRLAAESLPEPTPPPS